MFTVHQVLFCDWNWHSKHFGGHVARPWIKKPSRAFENILKTIENHWTTGFRQPVSPFLSMCSQGEQWGGHPTGPSHEPVDRAWEYQHKLMVDFQISSLFCCRCSTHVFSVSPSSICLGEICRPHLWKRHLPGFGRRCPVVHIARQAPVRSFLGQRTSGAADMPSTVRSPQFFVGRRWYTKVWSAWGGNYVFARFLDHCMLPCGLQPRRILEAQSFYSSLSESTALRWLAIGDRLPPGPGFIHVMNQPIAMDVLDRALNLTATQLCAPCASPQDVLRPFGSIWRVDTSQSSLVIETKMLRFEHFRI